MLTNALKNTNVLKENINDKILNHRHILFFEQDTVTETLLEDDGNVVWTEINNPDNDWYVIFAYSYVDKNTLKVIYEGDYNGTDYLKRKVIAQNELYNNFNNILKN